MRFIKLSSSYYGSATIIVVMAMLLAAAPSISAASEAGDGSNFDIPINELNKVKKETPSKKTRNKSTKKKRDEKNSKKSSTETTGALAKSENTQIYHSPYSFIIAGKRTVINAVINSKADIQEVRCTLPAVEGAKDTLIKMEKVDGTKFTYTATLPALPAETPSLRYTISFVDSQGNEIRSMEFATPVTKSPLIPSWQVENTDGSSPVADTKKGTKP